ncbi:hypothetical protein A1OE_425 [Candidatus Endolissoclinum faulkneri L2]|uniref:Uncharacterized protein n=1 Tax=Candidatus Endolissoclinum faulkneri L2 TaxID=1193729 RepID=K7Z3Q0_9PROT|nr:hypothetical protein A1OE_425 [Candidatus Endolissoclinum faulkneri L2]
MCWGSINSDSILERIIFFSIRKHKLFYYRASFILFFT